MPAAYRHGAVPGMRTMPVRAPGCSRRATPLALGERLGSGDTWCVTSGRWEGKSEHGWHRQGHSRQGYRCAQCSTGGVPRTCTPRRKDLL